MNQKKTTYFSAILTDLEPGTMDAVFFNHFDISIGLIVSRFETALMARCFVPTTSSMAIPVPEITGPVATTRRAVNLLTMCWMWCARRRRIVNAYRQILNFFLS